MRFRDRNKGLVAGVICFLLFAVPFSVVASFSMAMSASSQMTSNIIYYLIYISVFAAISTVLGFSVAHQSKRLTIISMVLILAVIVGILVYIVYAFSRVET